jgi:DNA-binding transcriptional MerR regulator
MSTSLRKIKDAAQQLGTSDQTLRLWANEFRTFMSPTAAPAPGIAREFNDVDLRLLTVVRDMRRLQRPSDEIHTELQRIVDTGDLPPMPEPPPSEVEKTAYLANVRDQWLVERTNLQRDISRLETDNEALRQQLTEEQKGRREDVERLSREASEERTLRQLYESGRLKPKK